MEVKIMYAALVFIAGWFYFYICLRQLIFDFTVGYPLIHKFGDAKLMVAVGAHRLNTMSVIIWLIICAGVAWAVIRFAALYLIISFGVGVLLGVIQFRSKLGPRTPSNFEAFCHTYYRFIPDEALQKAVYEADLPKIRAALRDLGSDLKLEVNKT